MGRILFEIGEERFVGATAKIAHAFRVLVKIPAVDFAVANVAGHFAQIVFAAGLNFGNREGIDSVEGGGVEAVSIGFGSEGANAAGDVEN